MAILRPLLTKGCLVTGVTQNFRRYLQRTFYANAAATSDIEEFKNRLGNYIEKYDKGYYNFELSPTCFVYSDKSLSIESMKGSFTKPPRYFHFEDADLPVLKFDDVFRSGFNALESYVSGDSRCPIDQQSQVALKALQDFIVKKGHHQRILEKMQTIANTETEVMSVITKHLLAQLLPCPQNYLLDYRTLGERDQCPCGCGEMLQYGVTSIGNDKFFHGSPDIVLFNNEENVFKSTGPGATPLIIQRDASHDDISDDSCDDTSESEDMLTNEAEWSDFCTVGHEQLLMQTIATSFYYRKKLLHENVEFVKDNKFKNAKLTSMLIPSCGITSSSYRVAMYDSANDVLLITAKKPLFEENYSLNFRAVVDLWMIVHHSVFCTGLWPEAIKEYRGSSEMALREDQIKEVLNGSEFYFRRESRRPLVTNTSRSSQQRFAFTMAHGRVPR